MNNGCEKNYIINENYNNGKNIKQNNKYLKK